jgi:mannose-6-phosphate isomerase-like protein (cupin superfamily)
MEGSREFFHGTSDTFNGDKSFRNVLFTSGQVGVSGTQVVSMCLPPGAFLDFETHRHNDQVFLLYSGTLTAILGSKKEEVELRGRDMIVVPAGTLHKIWNRGPVFAHFATIYAPPHHPPGTLHHTQKDAEEYEKQLAQEDEEERKALCNNCKKNPATVHSALDAEFCSQHCSDVFWSRTRPPPPGPPEYNPETVTGANGEAYMMKAK